MSLLQKTDWVCSQCPRPREVSQTSLDRSCFSPFSCTDEGEPLSLTPLITPHRHYIIPICSQQDNVQSHRVSFYGALCAKTMRRVSLTKVKLPMPSLFLSFEFSFMLFVMMITLSS